MAVSQFELPDHGSLHGELVEIRGLREPLDARDSRLDFLGEAVEANGKSGYAYWNAERGQYAVQTLDALLLEVPEANLFVVDKPEPEDGGHDLQWPSFSGASETFAFMISESLQAKGFCLIQMAETDTMRRSLLQRVLMRDDFCLPPVEFEEAYLGRGASSKVAWLDGTNPDEPGQDPLLRYEQYVMALVRAVLPVVGTYLGFKPHDYLSGTMLRIPMAEWEREELSPGHIGTDAIEDGMVEHHLDYLQRRRLCIMYLIDNDGGTLELRLRQDMGERTVRLPVTRDQLLIFRCDVLSYSYQPKGSGRDMVLQTWIMEEPSSLKIDGFAGDVKGMEAIVGGPSLPAGKEVHIMAAHCRYPGMGYGLEQAHLVWTGQLDGFKEISHGRFDMNLYYVSESEQFATAGKSVTKHTGCLEDREWIDFDNSFFGISPELSSILPPCQRVCLEMSMETLFQSGYKSLESLRGVKHMNILVADIGLDWENWVGYHGGTADLWLKSGHINNSVTSCNRLHYLLGLEGPCMQIDTACSASMVATGMAHGSLRKFEKNTTEAFVQGFQNILTPWPFIGLSGAGMVGRAGRSLFFDQSANGFARGEGWGGLFLRTSQSCQDVQDRLCVCASTFVNQDGRSASLTAPNGPSQQAVIRGSLSNVDIHPDDVVCTENHGTGTALGDPIEAGTVKAVFGRKRQSGPIPVTSGKSHIGHLEPAAGTVGILKTLVSLIHAAVPANVHLRHLNAHIEHQGFPVIFPVERVDIVSEYHYGGANGFGFGGTNARVDLWGRRLHRLRDALPMRELKGMVPAWRNVVSHILPKRMQHVTGITVQCAQCQGAMCWLCGELVVGPERHRCCTIREEFAPYDICNLCYRGEYVLAPPAEKSNRELPSLPHSQKFFLVGTWSAWSTFEPMAETQGPADADVYEGYITLGETRSEQFQVVMERHGTTAHFYPCASRANPGARIEGPETSEPGREKCWHVDGRCDGAMAGTVYRVRFAWGDTQKWITWEATKTRRSAEEMAEDDYWHGYSVVSSLSEWRPLEMQQHPEEPSLFEVAGRIPPRGEAEFVIQRDNDPRQTLYPLRARPRDGSVPVVGPDDGGSGKRWLLWGEPGELVIFRLVITETGDFSVEVISDSMGDIVWRSPAGHGGVIYDVAGSCFDWAFSKASMMVPDKGNPDIRRCHFKMSGKCKEEFQIVVNQNWGRRFYPEIDRDPPGAGRSCGPDGKSQDRLWEVVGYPGQTFEVVLNMRAEDTRRLVSCVPLETGGFGALDDDGRTEWTDEEWAEWEARWSAYGEHMAGGLYDSGFWPPQGNWPGGKQQALAAPPPVPPASKRWQEPVGKDLPKPWEEVALEE